MRTEGPIKAARMADDPIKDGDWMSA